jgi:hypothetical protein
MIKIDTVLIQFGKRMDEDRLSYTLPIHANLSSDDQQFIIGMITKITMKFYIKKMNYRMPNIDR